MKKNIRLILAFFLSVTAFAAATQNWKVLKAKEGQYQAVCSACASPPLNLHSSGGTPEIIKVENAPAKNVILIIYFSGSVGTQAVYEIERALIYDTDKKKVLGDAPWKYRAIGKAPAADQPEWVWKKESVKIKDPEFSEDHLFKLQ